MMILELPDEQAAHLAQLAQRVDFEGGPEAFAKSLLKAAAHDLTVRLGANERGVIDKDELRAVTDRVGVMRDRTDLGVGETFRLVLDIPKEWAVLAAWSSVTELTHRSGRPRPQGTDWICDPDGRHGRHHAKQWFLRTLRDIFAMDLHALKCAIHPAHGSVKRDNDKGLPAS